MAVSYEIFPDKQLIISHLEGELTEHDIISLRAQVMQDELFNPAYHVIDDVTGVTRLSIDMDKLQALSKNSLVQSHIRRALVARTDYQYGMARVYRAFSEASGHEFQVFRSIEEAMAWISKAA